MFFKRKFGSLVLQWAWDICETEANKQKPIGYFNVPVEQLRKLYLVNCNRIMRGQKVTYVY